MKKPIALIFILALSFHIQAQDIDYARKVLSKLTAKNFHGRGYLKKGDEKAAHYLARQFEKHDVQKLDSVYFQSYNFAINTLPGKITVRIDETKLNPGEDYVISCSAPSVDGMFSIVFLSDTISTDTGFILAIRNYKNKGLYLVTNYYPRKLYGKTIGGVDGIIVLDEKTPGWHVSNGNKVSNTVWLKIKKTALPDDAKKISVSATSLFIDEYKTKNVIGFVKGKKNPDRFIVFSAHYDHLGMMGNKTWFPGANDNGSGTAMVTDLARYYALPENQPDYSIAFMLFSGEEAGLHGSSYYADNPVFPLEQIRMLINLDMVGTGSEGITVVNGKAYKGMMDVLNEINSKNSYLPEIKARGEACNSDHCPFYKKGVKSIFIYTRGKEHMAYHTITDIDDDFPFSAYDGLFKLLTNYVTKIH